MLAGSGCANRAPGGIPVVQINQWPLYARQYGPVDISEEDLAEGLGEAFDKMSDRLGPINSEPIIRDYIPLIRKGLYENGYCRIQRLNINGSTVDMDIKFMVREVPVQLRIDVYLDGSAKPALMVANNYYVLAK